MAILMLKDVFGTSSIWALGHSLTLDLRAAGFGKAFYRQCLRVIAVMRVAENSSRWRRQGRDHTPFDHMTRPFFKEETSLAALLNVVHPQRWRPSCSLQSLDYTSQ